MSPRDLGFVFIVAGMMLVPVMSVQGKTSTDVIAPTADCKVQLPYGEPVIHGNIQPVCHTAYISYVNLDLKIPRFAAYLETGDHTFGCLSRPKTFRPDPQLPINARVLEGRYKNTGYDLGHNVPDQDMAYETTIVQESFYTSNVFPQIPEMNRQGWEGIEQAVRDFAYQRGEILVYTGSIVDPAGKKMADTDIEVPSAFYKVAIDRKTKNSIAFIMKNEATPKGHVANFQVSIANVEVQSGITFQVPEGTDKTQRVQMWEYSNSAWMKHHKELCKTK